MKHIKGAILSLLIIAGMLISIAPLSSDETPITIDYSDVSFVGNGTGSFYEVWDLTKGDLVIEYTIDMTGMVDDTGAHAWAEFGARSLGYPDYNPNANGVWMASDYDWTANTFDPDPAGAPSLDIDDKFILQRISGQGEGFYNLPDVPPNQWANHYIWFDRDGVDQWQALNPLSIDGASYNTGGIYNMVITLHAVDENNGTAFLTINGLSQGFETDGNWKTIELTPAGMNFTADMENLQVFYGIWGYGATHSVSFTDISVTGNLFQMSIPQLREKLSSMFDHKGTRNSIDAKLRNALKQFENSKEKTDRNSDLKTQTKSSDAAIKPP